MLSATEFFGAPEIDEKAAAAWMKLLMEAGEHRKNGSFSLCDDRPFWGIILRPGEECRGNVDVKGIANITISTNGRNQCY